MYRLRKAMKSIICLVTYHFNQFSEHYHGPDYLAILQDYDNELRAKVKYSDEEGSYEDARELLWEIAGDKGLNIWE